jgi:hypothetical protein
MSSGRAVKGLEGGGLRFVSILDGGEAGQMAAEAMLQPAPIEAFVRKRPDAVEERLQRRDVVKFVIHGKPVEKAGQTHDYKMMPAEYARENTGVDDLGMLVKVLEKACTGMGLCGRM